MTHLLWDGRSGIHKAGLAIQGPSTRIYYSLAGHPHPLSPGQSLRCQGWSPQCHPWGSPAPPPDASRVFIRAPSGKPHHWRFFGPWARDRAFLLQYEWIDHTSMLQTSTTQLYRLQTLHRQENHLALSKWERELACNLPAAMNLAPHLAQLSGSL